MAPNCSGGIRNSSSTPVKSRNALKKGPWTASEDMLLVEYVKKHGEGNWNAVQRNSGLMRCGKSCRLRWANHLRPNLKKGAFSPEEERLIVELHHKIGNKWARMAAQMPGRTDNEIKNYWNTRLKRRQRAGLPIYPNEIRHQQQQQLLINNSSSVPSSFSSLLTSSHRPNPNPYCFFNPSSSNHLHAANNGGMALSLASAAASSSFSSSPLLKTPFINQGRSMINQYNNSLGFGISSSCSGVGGGVLGLPSIQSVTPAASSSDHHFMMTTTTASSCDDAEEYEVNDPPAGLYSRCNKSTGLLEDLLGESQAAFGTGVEIQEDSCTIINAAAAGNQHEKADFGFCHGTAATSENNNYEGKVQRAQGDGVNNVDDDLLNLLDSFPLAVPIPDWNEGSGAFESPNLTNGTNAAIESQTNESQYNPVTTSSRVANQDWNFASFLWNNMPTIS